MCIAYEVPALEQNNFSKVSLRTHGRLERTLPIHIMQDIGVMWSPWKLTNSPLPERSTFAQWAAESFSSLDPESPLCGNPRMFLLISSLLKTCWFVQNTCIHLDINTSVYIYIYIFIYTCMKIYEIILRIHVHIHVHVHLHVCIFAYVYVYISTYIHICIFYMYIHEITCIHIYI